jgi:cell wall-associated NlpC family hydrolase
MVLIDSGLPFEHLLVERFDYSTVSGEWGEWAVLHLLAALGGDPAAPALAHLVIETGDVSRRVSAGAETSGIERRLRPGREAGLDVLWSARFSVPLEAVEDDAAVFTLLAGDRHPVVVALPAPVRHDLLNPILSVRERPAGRPRAIRPRQFAAVATTVAVTATSVPAAALATQVTTPTVTVAPAATTPATTQTATTPTTAQATPTPAAAPKETPRSHHPARHPTSHNRVAVTVAHHPVHRAQASGAASGCATSDKAGPTAYAATTTRTRTNCGVRSRPASAPQAASISFSAPAAPTSTEKPAASTTTTPTTATATSTTPTTTTATSTTPTTTTATSTGQATTTSTSSTTTTPSAPAGPGKATVTPVTHHAAPAVHHVVKPARSSGGASLAPSRPRPTSTPPPARPSSPPTSSSTTTVTTLSSTPGFTGPQSWTGSVAANPALTGAVTELSGLLSNGDRPPSFLIPIYMEAGRRYRVPWEVLAAINAIESDYGRNLNTSSAGAVGWMQFEPSTWAQYGMAVDGHSVPNPYDPRDAIFSAARYLAAAGAAQSVSQAVFAYNHASWYVDEVMSRARAIATHAQFEKASLAHGRFSVYFATSRKSTGIRYTSGVLSHYDRLIAAANMVSAANFPYVWGGGHTQPSTFGPFDCSGSVSYVMQQAGYKVPTSVSGDIGQWKFPAGPGQVTIFFNPTHTFMRIGNRYFGTSGFARPGGGAGWFDVDKLPASYLAGFNEVHVPNLGPDSFDGSEPPVVITPLFTRHRHRHVTSTLSFLPLMSTLGPFPGTASLPALPA